MVVDCHVHPEFRRDRDANSKEMKRIIGLLQWTGIDMACLMPVIIGDNFEMSYSSPSETKYLADILTEVMEDYPGKIFSLLMIDPNQDIDFLKGIISEYVIHGKLNGVKLLTDMNAADERLDPLADFLEKHDVPVLFHAWYKTVGLVKKESNPSEIACLAARHPSLRIVMAHLTGCRFRGVQDIKKHPNIFIDTSGSQPEDGYLEYALKELGTDRILFGSDYSGRDMAVQLGRIESLEMPAQDKDKILYKNALKVFKRGG